MARVIALSSVLKRLPKNGGPAGRCFAAAPTGFEAQPAKASRTKPLSAVSPRSAFTPRSIVEYSPLPASMNESVCEMKE